VVRSGALVFPLFLPTSHERIRAFASLDGLIAIRVASQREVIPISLSILAYIVTGLLSAVVGAGVYEFMRRRAALGRRVESEEQARQIVQSAQR
jgi:hypothetical protein